MSDIINNIVSSITENTDIDILKSFKELPSTILKLQVIKEMISIYSHQKSDLIKYHILVVLSRLFKELAYSISPNECDNYFKVINHCDNMFFKQDNNTNLSNVSITEISTKLSKRLKDKAASHLENDIIIKCPFPHIDLPSSKTNILSFKNTRVYTSVPVRLDLGMGGISDIPPYSLERYGNCINLPIMLNNEFPIEVEIKILSKKHFQFASKDLKIEKAYSDISEFNDQISVLRFHKEVTKFVIYRILHLNSFEDFYSRLNVGLRIQTYSHLPVGTGLGVSSLLLYSILAAFFKVFNIEPRPQTLFTSAVYLENMVGGGGGWEDLTAIYRGFKLMESFPDKPFAPTIKKVTVSSINTKKLNENLILMYTGITKKDQLSFDSIIERYCLKEAKLLKAIEYNNLLNHKLKKQYSKVDLKNIGESMFAQWDNWKIITERKCTNSDIDEFFNKIAPYIHGGRMNGAGKGGCAMLILKKGQKEKVIKTIKTILGRSARIYPWNPVI
jgi:galactokinase/mevalonate kinase-like predicted kinase